MVEKSGEEREKRAGEASARERGAPHCTAAIPQRLRYEPGSELLQYWGFSYGAFLGGTFASLYPDRVGRMIVDTERAWREFFNLCHAAGAGQVRPARRQGPWRPWLRTSTDECRTPDCVAEYTDEGSWSESGFGVYCTDGPDGAVCPVDISPFGVEG
ncbi:hypothetical protein LX32DRAFT_688435 [Colletotrichum zoysiae]|uniref:Uncharacterized protein n=1 Tax=Colletotrichum zoysiae TaxID=1216348 RepID=A0AAD9HWN1_9PEZI|nr:hypothetical protein LX32DRAFT_688435 [Colletotrichum zoysiae]